MLKARGKCLPTVAGLAQPEENHTGVRPRGRTGAAVPREPLPSEPLSHQTPPTPPERTVNSRDAGRAPSNRAAPHTGLAGGQEAQEGVAWLIPPAKSKTGLIPLLRKQARHISQALTSGTMRKLLIRAARLGDDTETKPRPAWTVTGTLLLMTLSKRSFRGTQAQ